MHDNLTKAFFVLAAVEIIAAIMCGVLSSRESTSLRKGRLRLAGTVLFGSVFCTLAIAQFVYLRSQPILNAEGVIDSATVHAQNRGHRTDFTVIGSRGATYRLNADGRSNFFRQGEHVALTYYGYTGSVIKVQFRSENGSEEGVFQSTNTIEIGALFVLGAFFCWCGYKKFHRDHEDAEVRTD